MTAPTPPGAVWTTVPNVLKSLMNMFSAAAPSAGNRLPLLRPGVAQEIAVIDGEPVSNLPATYVLVGYSSTYAATASGPSSALGVEGVRTSMDLSSDYIGGQQGETYKVWCEVSSSVGDSDPAAPDGMRQAVGDVWAACLRAVAEDPHLQGALPKPAYARVADFRWLLDQSPEGFACTVQFAVQVEGEAMVPYTPAAG